MFSINFSQAKTKFCLGLHYDNGNSYLFVNGKEIYKFCLGNISIEFDAVDSGEVSLKRNVYDFLVDYSATDKSGILNILKYLMIKNKVK